MIFHITHLRQWELALASGYLEAPSLSSEGFIHMCEAKQINGVLDRYFKESTDLLLIHVDASKLAPALRYEWSESQQESFPHAYGPINLNAIQKVEPI